MVGAYVVWYGKGEVGRLDGSPCGENAATMRRESYSFARFRARKSHASIPNTRQLLGTWIGVLHCPLLENQEQY